MGVVGIIRGSNFLPENDALRRRARNIYTNSKDCMTKTANMKLPGNLIAYCSVAAAIFLKFSADVKPAGEDKMGLLPSLFLVVYLTVIITR